jgi:hypothetical protein
MGRENFYPPNARDLFIQYLELIPVLIENINESVGNLLPPLPEQTEEEINLLLNPSPEQTEETQFLEAEDYMEDIINLNWFSETKSLEAEDYMEDIINLNWFSEKD